MNSINVLYETLIFDLQVDEAGEGGREGRKTARYNMPYGSTS
jgi:hypothetical protein